MSNAVVLDTTVTSLMLNQNPLLALYYTHLQNVTWLISFQTVAEMRYGARKANWGAGRQEILEQFLQRFHIVPSTNELAYLWADIKVDSQRAGFLLEAGDAWIAATARQFDAPLLTHDKDFSPAACPSITIHRYGLV